jgi:TolB-like protein/lipoprotein NlpI
MSRLKRLIRESHQRSLWQALAVYLGASFAVLEAVDLLIDYLGLPRSLIPVALSLLVVGLPVVIVTSLAKEETYGEDVPEEDAVAAAAEDRRLRLLTWRTAGLSFMAALALWGVAAAGLLLFGDYGPPSAVERKSVAVLPFANLSGDPDDEYFSDGITGEIINQLAKIADLNVIARTSVMRYKGTDKDLRQIGEELGVAAIVEGDVQRQTGRVRINAQLVDAESAIHLWAEQYNREVHEVFEIQSDVAQEIAADLKAALSPAEERRLKRNPTDNLDAYNAYLLGRYHVGREEWQAAVERYKEAIELDADYALAYSGLADAYNFLVGQDVGGELSEKMEQFARAEQAARRALVLDSMLGPAHASLAFVKLWRDLDWDAAERGFQQAIALDPSYAPAHHWYSALLSATGRGESALVEVQRARQLDPVSLAVNADLAYELQNLERYDEAIEQAQRTLALDSTFGRARWNLAWSHLYKGALDVAEQEFRLSGFHSPELVRLWFAALRDSRSTSEFITYLDDPATQAEVFPVYLAYFYSAFGETDKALSWLERGIEERSLNVIFTLKSHPAWKPIRSHPRFQAMLRQMRLD